MYNDQSYSFDLVPYDAKTIQSLKRIDIDSYRYDLKFSDQSFLDNTFDQHGDCDGVLMTKNGLLTDTSYANFVFSTGTALVTPALLLFEGVQRSHLLNINTIQKVIIGLADIASFEGFQLINAMNPLDFNR